MLVVLVVIRVTVVVVFVVGVAVGHQRLRVRRPVAPQPAHRPGSSRFECVQSRFRFGIELRVDGRGEPAHGHAAEPADAQARQRGAAQQQRVAALPRH